jgi:hypothetical protein
MTTTLTISTCVKTTLVVSCGLSRLNPAKHTVLANAAAVAAGVLSLLSWLALVMCVPASCLASQANADYTPTDVLNRVMASQKTVSNATFECVWRVFQDGPKSPDGKSRGSSRWEQQTFYWDNLGRRRNVLHGGPLLQDGKMLEDEDPASTDELFNGEIVVFGSSHPKWTPEGGKPASSKDAVGYTAVIIGDAAAQLRSGLESERSPLEYMRNAALSEIAPAIKAGAAAARPAEDGRVALDISGPDAAPYVRTVITVAPNHNWAIESVKSYRSDGKLAREIVCDYKEQADGLWVPMRLHHTHWGDRSQDDTPYFDWRFETTKAVFNEPSFDRHVFDVRLKPDTAVSDTRYKISYRVGKEEAVASDLARYAANDPAAEAPSLLGQALPAVQALKIDALPVALSNRMVLLCFFDLLQRPSRYCVTELAGRAAELDAKGVSMLAVQTSPVDPNALADFAKSNNLVCPLGRIESEEQKTRFNWGIRFQPWLILTDRSHIIRAEGFSVGELNEKLSAID